jgi:predicted nucleic acid-binding protein
VIIIDTSVLINVLRGKKTKAVEQLRLLERDETPFHIPVFCCQEILQGARNEHEWNLLYDNLSTQRILLPENSFQTHVGAARIYYDCRQKGFTVGGTVDCLVAQLVLENDGTLIHDDEDFERIARVIPIKTLA